MKTEVENMTKHEKLYSDLCDRLYDRWTNGYQSEEDLPNKTEPKEHTLEKISRTIANASITLASMLPLSLRRNRTAYLRMTRDEKRVSTEWYESISAKPHGDTQIENFESEVAENGRMVAELTSEQSEALSGVLIDYLFTDKKPFFPTYIYIKKEDNSIWFEWLPPCEETIEEKLKDNY
jgi:hypothetical protein